jgi:hypothetical protein
MKPASPSSAENNVFYHQFGRNTRGKSPSAEIPLARVIKAWYNNLLFYKSISASSGASS